MIKHIWSILCRKSIVDSESNLITLVDSFEQLDVEIDSTKSSNFVKENSKGISINNIDYELVSMWKRDENDNVSKSEVKLEIFDPKGNKTNEASYLLEIPVGKYRMRYKMKISGFIVTVSGDYYFKVSVKQQKDKKFLLVAEIPVQVSIVVK